MKPGQQVRLILDPGRRGVITDRTRQRAGIRLWLVQFPDQGEWVPEDQLALVDEHPLDPITILEHGQKLGRVVDLRRNLTHIRLSGKLANVVYSMQTTNTEFFAHQFKPVLKFLNSPANGLLIADEVGLGKTIEAGLLWTELRSRYDAQRLMILCPAMLRPKWREELREKFGVEAKIASAEEVLDKLELVASEGVQGSFALVCSMQGLRPNRGWDDEDTAQSAGSRLARFLQSRAEQEPLINLLVVDEAHYLRNPEAVTTSLGRLLRGVAEHVVLLSATPIHLRSADLFSLLNLLDEDTFNHQGVFDSVLEANAPLVRARELVMSGVATNNEIRKMLEEALSHFLLRNNRQLTSLLEELPDDEKLKTPLTRSDLAYRIETINLLGHVVTRTRKREITEWRVTREAIAEFVPLTPPERAFYDGVTQVVRDYCGDSGSFEGFLLAMPQRQIASSMPAALRHWRAKDNKNDREQLFDDLGYDPEESDRPGPLVQEIITKVARLADLAALENNDSKFQRLITILKNYFSDHPDEKVVLFSYFRATLNYLHERLQQANIHSVVLSGETGLDKSEVLASFRDSPQYRVLLSSEVGSEGIDLQFCRVLINYDMPWNPMRVEQRIGRLDRLGQKANKILIWNLLYADTIDSRIYTRLFARLNIFEQALGGLEAILGEKIQELTSDLLRGQLTPLQEQLRIDQTAQALENIKRHEEQLEAEASNLVAYGDYILNQVKAARELNRWISDTDIELYVRDFIQERFPGTTFRLQEAKSKAYDIQLSAKAKSDLGLFLEQYRLQRYTSLSRPSAGAIRCRFINKVGTSSNARTELINQLHPLVRFTSHKIREESGSGSSFFPAVAVTLQGGEVLKMIARGAYVFLIQRWSVQGLQTKEQLFIAAAPLTDGAALLPDDEAEKLIMTAAVQGEDWLEAENTIDRKLAAQIVAGQCYIAGSSRYDEFVSRTKNENYDRADIQLGTLSTHLENQLIKLQGVKAKHMTLGRSSLAAATQGHIDRLKNSFEIRKHRIDEGRKITSRLDDACVGVIRLV